MSSSVTVPPPQPAGMTRSLQRNIKALEDRRRDEAEAATRQQKLAEVITGFTGSMLFVYLHVAIYGAWVLVNLGVVPGVSKFVPLLPPSMPQATVTVTLALRYSLER